MEERVAEAEVQQVLRTEITIGSKFFSLLL